MSNVFSDQAVFMNACGQTTGIYNEQQFNLYKNLIKEEVQEFFESTDLSNTLKELMDIIVVTVGAAQSLGINPEDAWSEVAKSNMSKIDPETGKVLRREDGKILKGPNYISPDFSQFFPKV